MVKFRSLLVPPRVRNFYTYSRNILLCKSFTIGTTVLGAFDPLNEIADVCEKYNCWFHVDAAWGGGLLLSKKYRHPRLTGIER